MSDASTRHSSVADLAAWIECEKTGSDAMWQYDPRPDVERLLEQFEGERARAKWLEAVVEEGEVMERELKEQLDAAEGLLDRAAELLHNSTPPRDEGWHDRFDQWLADNRARIGSTPATSSEADELVCTCGGAEKGHINFDRSICACGAMHYFCDDCGMQAEPCDEQPPASAPSVLSDPDMSGAAPEGNEGALGAETSTPAREPSDVA